MKAARLLLGLKVIVFSTWVSALPEDRKQPIQISADEAVLDDRLGTATYRGAVKLIQGTLMISADEMILRTDGKGIQHMEAIGRPAHYQQQTQEAQPFTHGYARRIEYDVDRNLVIFIDQARLERAADRFQGERIEIDIARDVVNATGGDGNTGQRVEMVIQPRAEQP